MRAKLPVALIVAAALGSVWGVLPATAQQATPVAAEPEGAGGPEQDAGPGHRLTPADRAAFADARLAAVHAGLKLTPDQEKLWPPVEKAVQDMRTAAEKMRASFEPADKSDMIGRLKRMAERNKMRGEGLSKLAEAAQPLYGSLNEDQKWRLQVLMRAMHHRHMAMMERFRDGDRGKRPKKDDD